MIHPLSWKNDLLLLEDRPDHTINLNDLLEEKSVHENLLATPLANFYSILIKKREFIQNNTLFTRTRILPRMPYLSFNHYPFLKDELAKRCWLLAEKVRDYFYGSAMLDNSIKSWKQRIDRYTEGEVIPLPILRGSNEIWQQLTEQVLKEQQMIIQSAKGEQSTIPLKLTEKLVYLLGIIDGDGHLSKHQVHIVDYSKKQIEQLQRFFLELFGVTGNIVEGNDGNYYILLVNGKWIVRLINFITGHPTGRKYESLQEPLILKEHPGEHLRDTYWRGLFDADACFKQGVVFSTIVRKIAEDLSSYLDANQVNFTFSEREVGGILSFILYVPTGYRTKLHSLIGCWHPDKSKEFLDLLTHRRKGELEAFRGYANNVFTKEGYFNFQLLDNQVGVLNAGESIKQKRLDFNIVRKELAQKIGISYQLLAAYENNKATPPLGVVNQITKIFEEPLMPFLERESLNFFKVNKKVLLPLKPNYHLKECMKYLHPRSRNYISVLTDDLSIMTQINKQFSVPIHELNKKRISNFALKNFLTIFGIYKHIK